MVLVNRGDEASDGCRQDDCAAPVNTYPRYVGTEYDVDTNHQLGQENDHRYSGNRPSLKSDFSFACLLFDFFFHVFFPFLFS